MKASNGEALKSAGTESNIHTGNAFYSSSIRAVRTSVGWRLIPVFIATLVLIPVGTVVSLENASNIGLINCSMRAE